MLDLSFSELAVIALVAVLAVDPKDLPAIARTGRRWWRELASVKDEIKAGVGDIMKESGVEDVRAEIERVPKYIEDQDGNMQRVYDISDLMKEIKNPPPPEGGARGGVGENDSAPPIPLRQEASGDAAHPPPQGGRADMSDPSHARAPILAHLKELKKRLWICCAAYLAAFLLCYMAADHVYAFLVQPLAESFQNPEARRLIYTSLAEAFLTYVRLALFGAFFVAFPVIASQLYLFLAPGLYKKEKGVLLPYLVLSPLLFIAGAALAYYFILPAAWHFFIGFEAPGQAGGLPIQLEAKVSDYLSIVMQLIIAFGLAFQLPILLTLLVRTGMLGVGALKRGRRYAILIIVIVAGVLTPPDMLSQIALSIPLYLLYEVSILICQQLEKKNYARHQVDTREPAGL